MKIEQFIKTFIKDSKFFLKESKNKSLDDELRLRFIKASIISSWTALEGWLNCIAHQFGTFLSSGQIELHEKAFLLEKKLELHNGEWKISQSDDYQRVEDKILFLLNRFGPHRLDKTDKLWSDFQKIKKIRNGLVHLKTGKLEIKDLTISNADLSVKTVVEILNMLTKKIYKKELF